MPPGDPLLESFLGYWTSYMRQTNEAMMAMQESLEGNTDPAVWQRQFLDAASQSMDAYLRSPFFLQMLKTHIGMLIEAKRQADKMSLELARDAESRPPNDVAELLQRLSGIETALLSRLEQFEQRLEHAEGKLSNSSDAE